MVAVKKYIILVLIAASLLMGGCDDIVSFLDENLTVMTPVVTPVQTVQIVQEVATASPSPTATLVPSTPTPIYVIVTQEVREFITDGRWIIACAAPDGCKIRQEPSYLDFGPDGVQVFRTVLQGVQENAVAAYVCKGYDYCEAEVPLWYYLESGEWASGLVWIVIEEQN